MMMRKKMNDQGESKHDHNNKSTDIKENTVNSDNNNEVKAGNANAGESTDHASDATDGAVAGSDKVLAEVRAVEEKLAEMQDKYIRLSAEFDNYRKRTLREKMELSKYAGENLLLKIIPLMDDFERALHHIEQSDDTAALKNGVDLIYMKFSEFLKQ